VHAGIWLKVATLESVEEVPVMHCAPGQETFLLLPIGDTNDATAKN